MASTSELAHAREQLQYWQHVVAYLESSNGAASPTRRKRGPRVTGRLTIAQAAEKALANADGPMRTPDLLLAVRKEGATCSSSDNLYKTLDRSDRFKKAGRGLWTVAE